MSNWTTRLPYAHRYITKTLFEGAEADLDPPEKMISEKPVFDMGLCGAHWWPFSVYSRFPTKVYLKRIKRYYFEVPVTDGVQESKSREWLAIGYTGPPAAAILYANNGGILTNTHQNRGHVAIPYGAGDIIGCGYEFPSRFFFTKNGIYLGHCIAHLELNALRPEMITSALTADCPQLINLGQRPFMFDIEGHFDKRCARLQTLTADLPLEILENILQFALLSQVTSNILRLSCVCRRWHTLTFHSVIDLFIFTYKDLEDLLKIYGTRTPIDARSLNTQESPDKAWLHRFLTSSLPYIISTPTRLSIQTLVQHQCSPNMTPSVQRQRFLGKAPSFLSQRAPGLLRRTFTEVHTFKLSGYSFSTWTRFAQVVFALQRLETLVCSSVSWDSSPTTPPTWLLFSKRLRHASFEDMDSQCIPGLFWLFLAGRPRQTSDDVVLIPSDIPVIGQLASFIHSSSFTFLDDIPPPRNYTIIHDQEQDQPRSCTLSFIRQSRSSATPGLSFQFWGNGVTYQLTRICARPSFDWQFFSERDDSNLREIGRCWTALSSANLCHFRFELSGLWRSEGLFGRRRVAKAMMGQHSAGLLECTWNGEAIEDTDGVQWLKAGAAVTFGSEKTYIRGTSGRLTWDVDALHLNHRVIPWLKLYRHNDQITSGQFIADVAFDIDARSGQADFSLPDSAAPGWYFLIVGDYVYRTKCFQIIP